VPIDLGTKLHDLFLNLGNHEIGIKGRRGQVPIIP
jgi:hypothetical protein